MNNQNFTPDFHVDVIGFNLSNGTVDMGFVTPTEEYQYVEGHCSVIIPMGYPTSEDVHYIQVHSVPELFDMVSVFDVALTAMAMAKRWLDEVSSGKMN